MSCRRLVRLRFAAGETAKTVVLVAVDDAIDEPGEVVTLGLLAGSGYAVSSAAGSAEVKILDNDAPPVASISSGGSAVEGSAVSLTVSLSAASGYGLSVPYSVGGGIDHGCVVGLCLVVGWAAGVCSGGDCQDHYCDHGG